MQYGGGTVKPAVMFNLDMVGWLAQEVMMKSWSVFRHLQDDSVKRLASSASVAVETQETEAKLVR